MPSAGSFGVNLNGSVRQVATSCATAVGLDVAAFAACTGGQVVLTGQQQDLLDCAVTSKDAQTFGACAAPVSGMRLSDDQRIFIDCAYKSNGSATTLASCAGGRFANKALSDEQTAIVACAANAGGDASTFAACAAPKFLTGQQREVIECAVDSPDAMAFTVCAAPATGIRMSDDQRILARCALSSDGDASDFATCAGGAFLNNNLGANEQAVLGCAANAGGDADAFAGCAASKLFGKDLSREQRVALECAAGSGGDPATFGGCAAANMFGFQMNPEMQISVQCIAGTGGYPPAAAGCIASRLTLRELTKCISDGVGGKGCFGDSNDLVGKNGFVRRSFAQIAGGPNSLVNDPDQIWGGNNSFVRNPGQIFGGSNSFVRNPGQIFGGQNSVFNNPSQLAPKPLQVAKIGKTRICLPWC
jgi:hypothetical protein